MYSDRTCSDFTRCDRTCRDARAATPRAHAEPRNAPQLLRAPRPGLQRGPGPVRQPARLRLRRGARAGAAGGGKGGGGRLAGAAALGGGGEDLLLQRLGHKGRGGRWWRCMRVTRRWRQMGTERAGSFPCEELGAFLMTTAGRLTPSVLSKLPLAG